MKTRLRLILKIVCLLAVSLSVPSGCVSTQANMAYQDQQPSNVAIRGTGMPDYPDRGH
jgi:hypothetical protein